jgi:hypothetical protein
MHHSLTPPFSSLEPNLYNLPHLLALLFLEFRFVADTPHFIDAMISTLRALPHWTPVLEVLSLVITAPSPIDTFGEHYSTLDHTAPDLPRLRELLFSLRFSRSTSDMDARYKAYVAYISTQLPSARDSGLLAFLFVFIQMNALSWLMSRA